jgi:DNA-binding transcriptional LysR family regulator
MIAKSQYELTAGDLQLLLALSRGKTLAKAGVHLAADGSTVFRSLKRIEKGLGQRLFERAPGGYLATDAALRLLQHAEAIETSLQAARDTTPETDRGIGGIVRISAVDAVLNNLVVPALKSLTENNPLLQLELQGSNELSNLSRRDVDIALRSTANPPPHLVAKRLGKQRFAVFAIDSLAKTLLKGRKHLDLEQLNNLGWIGVDDAMPEHPGVIWRKRTLPNVRPIIQASSSLTAADAIEAGIGIGIVALFHARCRPRLVPLTAQLSNCEIDLWMLTHPESRHQQRIAYVAQYLSKQIILAD